MVAVSTVQAIQARLGHSYQSRMPACRRRRCEADWKWRARRAFALPRGVKAATVGGADIDSRLAVARRGLSTGQSRVGRSVGVVAGSSAAAGAVAVGVDSDGRAPHVPSRCRVPY